jgi:hypothetical protein
MFWCLESVISVDQCGGETLGPVVKHSVRDSRLAIGSFQAAVLLPVTFWSSIRLATARDRFSFELRQAKSNSARLHLDPNSQSDHNQIL